MIIVSKWWDCVFSAIQIRGVVVSLLLNTAEAKGRTGQSGKLGTWGSEDPEEPIVGCLLRT